MSSTDKDVNVPTEVIFVCAAVVKVMSATYVLICDALTFFSVPASDIAKSSPSAIVIPDPSGIPSILKTASTFPNSNALPPEFTFNT